MSQHDRTRDHKGTETTAAVTLDSAIAGVSAGSPLDDLLTVLAAATGVFTHVEVVMFDFGSGLEPALESSGDWAYGHYEGA